MTAELELAAAAVEQVTRVLAGAEVAVTATRNELALTRFANSVIHQNHAEDSTTVRVQIHHGGRTASGSGTVTDRASLTAAVEQAIAAVGLAPLDPGWPGLAPVAAAPDPISIDAAAAGATADARARVVRGFVDGAGGLEAAGYCRTNHQAVAFANSSGQSLTGTSFECGVSGIARDNGADGVARHAPLTLTDLDGPALGARAAAKARAWKDPVELPAGRYEVVLEPTAVADIVETLAEAAFNGKAVHEKRSFVRVGDQQFDPLITMLDDPLAVGQRFDADGTPRARLTLIDRGTSVAVAHDRRSAKEAGGGALSTGHSANEAFWFGPASRHACMLPTGLPDDVASEATGPAADSSVAELVAGVERGLLVSDFWYTRMLDPRTLAITGLTRNGVWLIEDGVVTTPLRNFRFTQSYAQALMSGNVRGVGRTATPIPGDTYGATSPRWTCPALHLGSWNFTGGASG